MKPGFRQLIADHYMIPIFRIHEKKIRFAKIQYSEDRDALYITEYQTILPFLRNFGHLITSLKFSDLTSEESTTTFSYIEQYCSNTLVEFELDRLKHTIDNESKKFKRVTKLTLEYWYESDFSAIELVYPALEELTVKRYDLIQPSLGRNFPNLKRLHLIEKSLKNFTDGGIRNFVDTNPQLRTLSIERVPSFELLKHISETSKNLESLSISYNSTVMSAYNEVVHFDTIKKLTVKPLKYSAEESNPMITFGKLESLEIVTLDKDLVPIELIRQQNIGLKSLSLKSLGRKQADILNESGPFQALEEVKLMWEFSRGTERVLNDMETVKKITYVWYQVYDEPLVFDKILNRVQGNWHLSDYFLVDRKYRYDLYDVVITRDN